MRINNNIMAYNAQRNLGASAMSMGKSIEKLSSGLRINRAADDASGLVISQKLRAQTSGLKQATRNAQDGISVVQTAEGGLNEVHSMLNRMRDLAVQAANTGANDTTARNAAQAEVDQLLEEINRIGSTTSFGDTNLLDGTYGATPGQISDFSTDNSVTVGAGDTINVTVGTTLSVGLQEGVYTGGEFAAMVESAVNDALTGSANATDNAAAGQFSVTSETSGAGAVITFSNLGSTAITVADGTNTPLVTEFGTGTALAGTVAAATGSGGVFQIGANEGEQVTVDISGVSASILSLTGVSAQVASGDDAAITAIDAAISTVSADRGALGATQNRFESTIANLSVTAENVAASESRIRDTDVAAEMVEFTRTQIMQQAGTAMLGQANLVPQSVLRLLG